MNLHAVREIYRFEMARTFRTIVQSILAPVLTTSLYFVVFGSAIGSRMTEIGGVPYGAFIVPGLIMLSILTESIGNASFGIYFPKWSGTIYELLSAPVSTLEIVLGYVGAAATKSILIGVIILLTSSFFVPLQVLHPFWMLVFLLMTARDLQPVRIPARRLGDELGEAAVRAAADRHAPDLPGRQLLLTRHAAAGVAHDHAVQSRGLPDQRFSLELLRPVRRQRGVELLDHRGHHGGLPRDHRLDDPHRLATQELRKK